MLPPTASPLDSLIVAALLALDAVAAAGQEAHPAPRALLHALRDGAPVARPWTRLRRLVPWCGKGPLTVAAVAAHEARWAAVGGGPAFRALCGLAGALADVAHDLRAHPDHAPQAAAKIQRHIDEVMSCIE